MDQTSPVVYFCGPCKLRMAFTYLNGWKINSYTWAIIPQANGLLRKDPRMKSQLTTVKLPGLSQRDYQPFTSYCALALRTLALSQSSTNIPGKGQIINIWALQAFQFLMELFEPVVANKRLPCVQRGLCFSKTLCMATDMRISNNFHVS